MNRKIAEEIQSVLTQNGVTLQDLWEYCGNKHTATLLEVPGRERATVYVEKFGKDGALVLDDGRIIGRPLAYMGHHYYVGNFGPDRVGAWRTTIVPDGYR